MTVDASYVLPIRWSPDVDADELSGYLAWLEGHVAEVLVVDGSDPERFADHAARWAALVRHLPPHDDLRFVNGKVNGVVTGLREATHDRVIVADDDVRYDERSLDRVVAALAACDAVVPQNYFDPLPWFARWDTGRTLLNRITGGDFPGTVAVRREPLLRAGGYDGDVMFENLEMLRTVEAAGGTVRWLPDCFVRRLPGTAGRFVSQRVRQAYDEFARPRRLAAWLSVAPTAGMLLARRRRGTVAALAASTVAAAEIGRRRHGGRHVFAPDTPLFAPLWVAERAMCSWVAVAMRLTGGVRYRGGRIKRAATPVWELRERVALRTRAAPARCCAGTLDAAGVGALAGCVASCGSAVARAQVVAR